jgi:transcriptional regulator with XRE-family HTH domain
MDATGIKSELRRRRMRQTDLAARVGIHRDQLNKALNGKRRFQVDEIDKIRAFFAADDGSIEVATEPSASMGVEVPEVDLTLGAADGGGVQTYLDPEAGCLDIDVVGAANQWTIPQEWIDSLPTVGPKRIFLFRVVGTSMVPEFRPGERVFVNAMDRNPSPAGHFVVWDGFSLVIKFVEAIPHSSPPRIVLRSHHPMVDPYERSIDEAFIQGRVVSHLEFT